jgi:hypothetical protein
MTRLRRSVQFAAFMAMTCVVAVGAAAPLAALGGCAGDSARVNLEGPQIASMAPDILADAAVGAHVQALAGAQQRGDITLGCDLAEVTGVTPISAGLAETKQENRLRFRALVDQFARRSRAPADDGGGGNGGG